MYDFTFFQTIVTVLSSYDNLAQQVGHWLMKHRNSKCYESHSKCPDLKMILF